MVPTVAEPSVNVPDVRLSTLEPDNVIAKPPSLKILLAVTSPMVSVVSVAAPQGLPRRCCLTSALRKLPL